MEESKTDMHVEIEPKIREFRSMITSERRISINSHGACRICSFMAWKKSQGYSTQTLTCDDTIIKLLKIWSDLVSK